MYNDASLCEVCACATGSTKANQRLVASMDRERGRCSGVAPAAFAYPGNCNGTKLNHSTATVSDSGVSFERAFPDPAQCDPL